MPPAEPQPIREFDRVTCYRVKVVTGEGIADDPVRHITYWFTEDGDQIARDDPWEKEQRVSEWAKRSLEKMRAASA